VGSIGDSTSDDGFRLDKASSSCRLGRRVMIEVNCELEMRFKFRERYTQHGGWKVESKGETQFSAKYIIHVGRSSIVFSRIRIVSCLGFRYHVKRK
jgi:hypothetical protein